VVHEDAASILLLDREPIVWERGPTRGMCWSEQSLAVDEGALRSWQDAATVAGACGLVVDRRRRYVHSSVSGVGSLYYLADGDAVYFASSVDALVMASEERLSVDWDAWSAILAAGNTVNERTPFAEIRRLAPYSLLDRRRGQPRVREQRWPWAEIDADLSVRDGAALALAEMREAIGRMGAGQVVCPLSGGWDSRLLLRLLVETRRADLRSYTTNGDIGTDRDERFAAAVAAAFDVPNEVVPGEVERFWEEAHQSWLGTDHQLVGHPWRYPIITRLRGLPVTIVDGLGLDSLAQPGERFVTSAVLRAQTTREAARALWQQLKHRNRRRGVSALTAPLASAFNSGARRQLVAVTERFAGHPALGLLTVYRARTVTGVSLVTTGVFGAEFEVASPFTDDAVARAVLRVPPRDKFDSRVYRELFAALDPLLDRLPSTNDPIEAHSFSRTPQRREAPANAAGFRSLLLESPLAPYLRSKTLRVLGRQERGRPPKVPLNFLGPSMFGAWHARYRERLREVDPRELL
jgi:Asparagine synthase